MDTNTLMTSVINTLSGDSFYRFANADGKVWLMPVRNMPVAMHLYQPSGIKGKLLKWLFPYLHNIKFVRNIVNAEKTNCELNKYLKDLFCCIFSTSNLEFAVFGGTPCVHQKITIQLFNGKHILGYCKVADNEDIAVLFQGEAEILQRLEKQGVKGIPHCLYCGETKKGISVFVQSTVKTQRSQVLHKWNILHDEFMKELQKRTQQSVSFEESDYYHTLCELQNHLNWLPSAINRESIKRVIDRIINSYHGKQVEFSAYHADFTPWNMFVEKGRLFVFDWEYAQLTYPPQLDKYHFFTQTAIFERRWKVQELIGYIESGKGSWIDKEKYSLYLIEIMARFTIREKGNVTGDIANSFTLWMNLLEYLQK